MDATPVVYTKDGKRPYVPYGGMKTHYVTLDFESGSYWIFLASDVSDPVFPDAWKTTLAKFCRWWVTDHERPDDLRDVSGVLQLTSPLSAIEVREHIDSTINLTLLPCTLAQQAGFIPELTHSQKFVVHEYGEQRFPKSVAKLPSYNTPLTDAQQRYANIAVRLGMNVRDARDPAKVREFFRQRRLRKEQFSSPAPSAKRPRPTTPVKHLTQSLGDIPNPDYVDHSDPSDGHISTDDDEINNIL